MCQTELSRSRETNTISTLTIKAFKIYEGFFIIFMWMKKLYYLFLIISFFSCQEKNKQKVHLHTIKVVEVHGHVVPQNSIQQPKTIPAGKPAIVKAGNPKITATNTNINPAGIPTIVTAGKPLICTPGQSTFLLPKIVPAIDNPFLAETPEAIIAKDMANKDQNSQNFSTYGKLQGLKHGTIGSMLQDKKGNLWFGTDGGVSKYDGKSFNTFTEKEGLANNTVWCILEDKNGNLWFGTAGGGASKYDGKSFTTFTDKEGLTNNTVLSMLEDKSGNLWFGTDGGGVSKYDGKSFTTFADKEGLASNTVRSILEDKSGNLWFGTSGGVSKYDGKSFTTFTDKEGLANNTVLSMLEDKNGNLWFGTDGGGVSKYDGNRIEAIEVAEKRREIIPQQTQQDLKKINGKLVKSFTTFTDKEGLTNNTVLSMLEDKSGNLWFGTNGGGVSKYDGKSFTTFTDQEGLVNNTVWSILEDKSGNLWFGTIGGVSKYDGKSFTTFTDKEGLANNTVLSILEDKSGNLWFGTYGGGVSKYDGNRIEAIEAAEKRGEIIPQRTQQDLKKINGKLVKSFTTFTDKEGLANNTVLSMLEDKSGNLWFGTRFGLSKLTIVKLVEINEKVRSNTLTEQDIIFKKYTYTDGFLGIGVNGGKTMLQAKDGTIWIGANDRLTAMHPENMQTDTIAPNIQLTAIDLFNENISWVNLEQKKDSTLTLGNGVAVSNFEFDGITKWYTLPENLSLAYNNNYLTFNFIGITMSQPKNVKYQYILEGNDENWSAITNKTSAPYGNLPHGTYTFNVKAMNSEGYWSKPFEYKFTIRPPFWQTWWFRTLVGLLILSSIWYYIKSREKKLVAEKEKLEKTVEERTIEVFEEKKLVEQQKHIVEEKQKEILDSINYAKRIQYSLLAGEKLLNENLKNYFLFFKPKDIVSGDFYWGCSTPSPSGRAGEELFVLVTADSTGHGVPGAIMSMLNISCLNEAINADKLSQPADILNSTRKKIIEHLSNDGSEEGGKDGMDCSLISFDFKNKKLVYAAANNPVWIIRNNTFISLASDRMPIGKHDKDSIPFTQHEFELNVGDMVYTLTDGFPDQFGGPKGKKFKYKQLEELLMSIAHKSMETQKQKLEEVFENWKGDLEQIDDVCIIGVKI